MDNDEPSHIIDHIYIGSKFDARNKEILEHLGITHILNVTPNKKVDPIAGVPNFFEKDKSFIYSRCPIYDNNAEDITSRLQGCIAFIQQAEYYGKILVHCVKGISRSPSIVIAYIMKKQQLKFEEALDIVTSKRSIACPNENFQRQLKAFEHRLNQMLQFSAMKQVEKSTDDNKYSKTDKSSGKMSIDARVKQSIGPQLPPKHNSNSENVKSHDKVRITHVIGPSLPPAELPTAGKKRKPEHTQTNEEDLREEHVKKKCKLVDINKCE